MRLAVAFLSVLALVSCSRDPNVVKQRYLENGNKYFDKGKYKEAIIMYRNALQKDMRFGPAHYKLALAALKTGQMPQAVASLRRAVELLGEDKPEHWDAAIKLSELYLVSRDKTYLSEVEIVVDKLIKRDPDSFDGHRLSGDANYIRAINFLSTNQKEDAAAKLKVAISEYQIANRVKPGQQGLELQMARVYRTNGDFAESEKIYRTLIQKDKTSEPVYSELYGLYMSQNKANDAEQTLQLAIANNPKQYGFLRLLATHYYLMNRRDDMVKVLGRIKSHAKEFNQAYLLVGDFYLAVGDNDEAVKQYKEGIAADAKQKSTYQKRIIESLMRQNKRTEAAEVNAAILKDNPSDNDARGLQASLMLDKGDITKAQSELQSVIGRDPKNPVAHYNLGRAHLARGEREWELARQEFVKAIEIWPGYLQARIALTGLQLSRREYDAAYKSAQEILAIDRQNATAQLAQSAALMGMKKFSEARQMLDAMQKAHPSSPDVAFQLGVLGLSEKKLKDAEEAFRKAYQLNPANPRGLLGVVECYMAAGKNDQAIQLLEQEADKAPSRLDLRAQLGNTAVRAGRYDLALAEFQKVAAGLDPKSRATGDIYLRIGETYRRKGDLGSAVTALQKARETLPDNTIVLGTLALTLDAGGRKNEARQVYEQTIKLDPGNPVALNNLAFLMAETGTDLDQALTLAQRAKQILPTLAEVSDTLGWIYLKKNLSDNAIEIFRDLVAKQPNHSTYRYHLGMALSQKGDKPKALKELQEALKSNPPKDEKEKIEQLIAKLG